MEKITIKFEGSETLIRPIREAILELLYEAGLFTVEVDSHIDDIGIECMPGTGVLERALEGK